MTVSMVCDVNHFPIIGDLLADFNWEPCAWNLIASNAPVSSCKAALCFDHYLIALAWRWNVEGDLICVSVVVHVCIIPYEGDSLETGVACAMRDMTTSGKAGTIAAQLRATMAWAVCIAAITGGTPMKPVGFVLWSFVCFRVVVICCFHDLL